MSLRRRKRRQERILNTETITVSAPREVSASLPRTRHLEVVRARPTYYETARDRILRDVRTKDLAKHVFDRRVRLAMDDMRRLHVESDIRRNDIDPYGNRYIYERINVGRDEKVILPESHPICREREDRREVLFAKNKAGKAGQKPPRRPRILIECKRS